MDRAPSASIASQAPDQTPTAAPTTRLAPSPTGALHLGNARTFLVNWALARQRGWRVLMRIEDLDGPRVKPGADMAALADLRWLGLDWDGPASSQRADLAPYEAALRRLAQRGVLYRCTCRRADIRGAQSAPHGDQHELRYPGTCRPRTASGPQSESDTPAAALGAGLGGAALRVRVPDEPIRFNDQIHGPQTFEVAAQVGDFVVATRAGLPAYQLAVVVDDARQGVTEIVRGADLLASTARQILLAQMLGLDFHPRYWHLPLVLGPDRRRLAKRHGDTRLAWYREHGVEPARIVGLLAWWCGLSAARQPMDVRTFCRRFAVERLPPVPVLFTAEDHAWLIDRGR